MHFVRLLGLKLLHVSSELALTCTEKSATRTNLRDLVDEQLSQVRDFSPSFAFYTDDSGYLNICLLYFIKSDRFSYVMVKKPGLSVDLLLMAKILSWLDRSVM